MTKKDLHKKLKEFDTWTEETSIVFDKNLKNDEWYVINKEKINDSLNKTYEKIYDGQWIKKEEKTIIAPENMKDRLKELIDVVEKQRDDTTAIGTLKIRDNKLILERNLKEIVICDLDDKDAAAAIMASLAKIQLEELSSE